MENLSEPTGEEEKLDKAIKDKLGNLKPRSNKETLDYLLHSWVFWIIVGALIYGSYQYSISPHYNVVNVGNLTYVNSTYKGYQINYFLNLETGLCEIRIPSQNFVWVNVGAMQPIPANLIPLILKTKPSGVICDLTNRTLVNTTAQTIAETSNMILAHTSNST